MQILIKRFILLFFITFSCFMVTYAGSENEISKKMIDNLQKEVRDPYAASIPLMASAGFSDMPRYRLALSQMMQQMKTLETSPESYSEWMRSQSFKAWMWGRVLVSADAMRDVKYSQEALLRLKKALINVDNPAFDAWAWGYRAAYNNREYATSKLKMMRKAEALSTQARQTRDHAALSDALWAWVMNLSAAAYNTDYPTYLHIKKKILMLTGARTVEEALKLGLLRTEESNDYPAWALAKVRSAAIMMHDKALVNGINYILGDSIKGARAAGADAEYILAVAESQQ